MSATITDDAATVPITDGRSVEIEPGTPWPSTYRGSRYSLVDSRQHRQTVLQWKYRDLVVMVEPPTGLVDRLRDLGKSAATGKGSVRITASGHVLTKIHSDEYVNAADAPVDSGWIPVYVGRLDGDLGFDVEIDPTPPADGVDVWSGFPFNHGERWSVGHDGQLVWKWQDYRFTSAFEHPELVAAYERFRASAGRLYVNEFGHVFANVPQRGIPESRQAELQAVYDDWQRRTERRGDTAARRLVNRRLKVTGDGDPEKGHLPLYLGHLSQFDDGAIPQPVVTDESYYVAAARGEELSGR